MEVASLHSAALAGLGEAMLETDPAGAAELATRALKVHPHMETLLIYKLGFNQITTRLLQYYPCRLF